LIDARSCSRTHPELRSRIGALIESPSLYPNLIRLREFGSNPADGHCC
jgi:hypothetical protein